MREFIGKDMTSGHTELFCLLWVQQIFLALYVWYGSSVYEILVESPGADKGAQTFRECPIQKTWDNQSHFVIIELCKWSSFLSVAMIKHSDQSQLSGGQGLFGLYFQGIVYLWEESAGTLSRNHVYFSLTTRTCFDNPGRPAYRMAWPP